MKVLQILFLVLGLAVCINAQKAILTGTVFDANGAVIPKSKVTATNQKGDKYEAFTNEDGIYKLDLPYNEYKPNPNFRIAKYEISVEGGLPGFEKYTLKDFKIVGKYVLEMKLDFALDAMTYSNPITVPAENKKHK